MSEPIHNLVHRVITLPQEIDEGLAKALGSLTVAFGRLEYMFILAIKRLQQEVEEDFEDMGRIPLGPLIQKCETRRPQLKPLCEKGKRLNQIRQDFIHATFGATEEGAYVRFRKLVNYENLSNDIAVINNVTQEVNRLIEELDCATGAPLSDPSNSLVLATLSVRASHLA